MTAILGADPRPLSDQAIVTVVANHHHTVHGVERAIAVLGAVVDPEVVVEVVAAGSQKNVVIRYSEFLARFRFNMPHCQVYRTT